MKNEQKNTKYLLTRNNYVGLLFFALVLASALYIIKHETETFKEIEPSTKAITTTEKAPTEITEENDQIKELASYLNLGDRNTFKIYQSMYNVDNEVTIDSFNEETMLYVAYKYLEKTTDFSSDLKYITCEEAEKVNLTPNIIQCGGSKYNISYYTVNHQITKELLKETVMKIFNRTIQNFTNFYTSEDNLCYFIENEYLCISHKTNTKTPYAAKEFVKAIKYDNKIEIIEKYRFVNKEIYYQGFNSDKVGEGTYISTFTKTNGTYHWESTKLYSED